MTLLPGEVVLIPFPFSDLQSSKRRPVLVLRSCDRFGDFLAAAITSQAGHEDGFVFSQNDLVEGHLPKTSWVRVAKLYTLNRDCVVSRFGVFKPDVFARVRLKVCGAVGCLEG
jgi:mRNA interferase MazF